MLVSDSNQVSCWLLEPRKGYFREAATAMTESMENLGARAMNWTSAWQPWEVWSENGERCTATIANLTAGRCEAGLRGSTLVPVVAESSLPSTSGWVRRCRRKWGRASNRSRVAHGEAWRKRCREPSPQELGIVKPTRIDSSTLYRSPSPRGARIIVLES